MKNIIIICLLATSFNFAFSQTHRFVYELTFKRDSTKSKLDSTKLVLDIGENEVKFYDMEFLVVDSISKNKNEKWIINSESQQLIKRKKGSNIHQNYRDNLFDYFLIESKDDMKWKISPETKKVAEYQLQKAETNFGGRSWIAWFCKDIPMNEGPYKFQGLPGLIFEIADTRNDYSYKLINSKKLEKNVDTTEFLETHYGNKPIKITNKKLNEVKFNYYNNPYSWAMTATGTWSVDFGDGKIYNKKEDIPYLTKRTQEELRRNNNPIELDIAIKYPLK
ncbi:GLPGLI family protein [Kaistella sp.]|uniref:GLPGLI family protein n=1 Tax=Kaistella sp. TaxID=2782235 RepID=UPI003C407C86